MIWQIKECKGTGDIKQTILQVLYSALTTYPTIFDVLLQQFYAPDTQELGFH
jgi:hypothetical protein